jgi:hypothetical protein
VTPTVTPSTSPPPNNFFGSEDFDFLAILLLIYVNISIYAKLY